MCVISSITGTNFTKLLPSTVQCKIMPIKMIARISIGSAERPIPVPYKTCLLIHCLLAFNVSLCKGTDNNMIIVVVFLVSSVVSHPMEYRAIINEGEFIAKNTLMRIMPSGFAPPNSDYFIKPALADVVDRNKPSYKRMIEILESGNTKLGLTFNIYDDNMREAAIAVYKLLLDVEDRKYNDIERWARVNVNADMFDYATRLASLYGNKFKQLKIPPPFIKKPNYFVTGETMWKAMHLKVASGLINGEDAIFNQYDRTDNVYTVNSNYSGWNLLQNGCDQEINYFKEDVALNSYYYGLHLLHPFWMTNEDLDEVNSRHAEHFYFAHKQLMARYRLEKAHLGYSLEDKECDMSVYGYNSYLIHDYGLPFPIKASSKGEWTDEKAKIKAIDIAITECLSRGLIMDNGSAIPLGEEYNIDLVSKIVRANMDSPQSAKIIRSVYGYGGKGYPIDKYNPAPSILHFPQTSLRDQTYWHLIENFLQYFMGYLHVLEPIGLENDIDKDIIISNFTSSIISTFFDYYTFSLNKGLGGGLRTPLIFAARQRRLRVDPVVFEFTVNSAVEKDVVVRLFLGPSCSLENCWNNEQFFELDVFKTHIKKGINLVNWTADESDRFSWDQHFNRETTLVRPDKYNIFRFPGNLIIPKGLQEGLNLTLFVMITNTSNSSDEHMSPESNNYNKIVNVIDDKPLGFPFHRRIIVKDWCTSNCRFYNLTIYHRYLPVDASGQFSPNLY